MTYDVLEDTQSNSKRQQGKTRNKELGILVFLVRLVPSLQKKRLLATDVSEFQLDLILIVSKAYLQIPGSPNQGGL